MLSCSLLDDVSTAPDGSNSYQAVIDAGRFKYVYLLL